jgi:exportin-7
MALTSLKQVQSEVTCDLAQKSRLTERALSLMVVCLNFDFIGTNADESVEDLGTVQLPTPWRSVVQEPATMSLLFEVYAAYKPPQSSIALEVLMLLSSVRRSLFAADRDRARFLDLLLDGTRSLLRTQLGLAEPSNHHEFCRLLGRIKSNYQLGMVCFMRVCLLFYYIHFR